MEEYVKIVVAILSAALALASFVVARRADVRAKKAESVRQLLGDKQFVAFGALKLLRDGLPKEPRDRQIVFSALMQACVFEGSDRARALLYRVIELNRVQFAQEIELALQEIRDTFDSMDHYQFTLEELDLERGRSRINAVERVVNGP